MQFPNCTAKVSIFLIPANGRRTYYLFYNIVLEKKTHPLHL